MTTRDGWQVLFFWSGSCEATRGEMSEAWARRIVAKWTTRGHRCIAWRIGGAS